MSANTTRIVFRFSSNTSIPTDGILHIAEPAYSYNSNTLYIGTSDGAGSIAIGGKYLVDQSNAAFNYANTVYNIANAAFSAANNVVSGGPAYDTANAAFAKANTTYTYAANNVQLIANAAFDKANTANYKADLALASTGLIAYTKYEYDSAADQNTFSATYTEGYVDVFINGAKLSSDDFIANTGTNVILTYPTNANDVVEIIAWSSYNVAAINFTSGPLVLGYAEKTGNYTIDPDTDYCIKCDNGIFNVTLPTAVNAEGQVFVVKNANAGGSGNVINVLTTSSETIDGFTPPVYIGPLSSLTFMSDNVNWIVI